MYKWVVCIVAFVAATASAAIPSSERAALIELYQSTGGAEWIGKTNWLGAAGTECTWFGVTCNEAGTAVLALELPDNNLSGTIPPGISQLLSIEVLDLSGGALSGSLVPVTSLTTLRELWLALNEFEGPIPIELRALRNLEALDLGFNDFNGTIPKELAELTHLKILGLYFTELEGEVPVELWHMSSLTELYLVGNYLTGVIPADIGNLTNVEILFLWDNFFFGDIPSELGLLTRLVALDLSLNDFSGVPPASLGALTNLEVLGFGANRLSGPIPSWLAGLQKLTNLSLDDNDFTGPVPGFLWNLTNLRSLGFGLNHVTGSIPPAIRNLENLQLISFHYTAMSGPLPREIGELTNLQYVFGSASGLSGPIPPEIGNLRELLLLWLFDNNLEGPIPPQIGNLVNIEMLNLGSNRLSGAIPPEIGNLENVAWLQLERNALRGPIPREITRLTALNDRGLWSDQNALTIDDPEVRQFMEQKDLFGGNGPQTVTPENLRVVSTTDRSAVVAWDRINHYWPGGYQVVARTTPGGPPVSAATTEYFFEESIIVRNLAPETTYYFTVSAISYPSFQQKNLIVSDPSAAVSATTGARVLAPPEVEVTEAPSGLIQVDGVPRNEDQFTVTNVGDLSTAVTLDIRLDFATVEPEQFTLEGGASRTVTIRSISRPPGRYFGTIWTLGEGAVNLIPVSLLSSERPAGTVRAEAVESRVEVAGEPGSDSIGQARFRNVGDSMLTGILVSDQPWVVPDDSMVFISPGLTGAGNFTVVRSRRPQGVEGALVANLSLVYVDGGASDLSRALGGAASGVSVTKVTVVDVSKPATSSSTIPPGAGQVAYFLPGVSSFVRGTTSFVSDVSLLNNSPGAVSDLRLYFTPAAVQQTTVATLSAIPATNSVTLANILGTVYGAQSAVGSIQIRSASLENVVVQAKLLGLSENGTVSGPVPVFRSDRSLFPGDQLYLAGLRKSESSRTDIYLQETSGLTASVTLDFVDERGRPIGPIHEMEVSAWGVAEMADAVPAGAVTVTIGNLGSGQVAAYARVFDDSTGDHWTIVDWSRYRGFRLGEPLRVPFIAGNPQPPPTGGGRRRAVSHSTRGTTDLVFFNPGIDDALARLQVFDAGGSMVREQLITVEGGTTFTMTDAGASARTAAAHAVVTPLHSGELVMTARTTGAGVPVLPAGSGLRLGRSQIFSSLADSTSSTVSAAVPGTFRTTLGLVETGDGSAVVRARIFLDEGRSLASSVIYRDFNLGPHQQIIAEDLVRSIVGGSRDSLGELHNLQLRVEVISGSGAVVPFVITSDNATGDALLRLE